MNVHVKIFGALQKPQGRDDFSHEIKDGATVEKLLLDLGYHPRHVSAIVVELNGKQTRHTAKLAAGDELVLSLAIGGG
ncbi:MAG TPA: MoaD/ThiS family protein [Candidatus Ozemobacteraceae bacterium]|nr:MoaD/ThiS family protein [Candidatus Ozemobacteraceae bacterium]